MYLIIIFSLLYACSLLSMDTLESSNCTTSSNSSYYTSEDDSFSDIFQPVQTVIDREYTLDSIKQFCNKRTDNVFFKRDCKKIMLSLLKESSFSYKHVAMLKELLNNIPQSIYSNNPHLLEGLLNVQINEISPNKSLKKRQIWNELASIILSKNTDCWLKTIKMNNKTEFLIDLIEPCDKHADFAHLLLKSIKNDTNYSKIQHQSMCKLLHILNNKKPLIELARIKKELFIIDNPTDIFLPNGNTILHLLMQYPLPSLKNINEYLNGDLNKKHQNYKFNIAADSDQAIYVTRLTKAFITSAPKDSCKANEISLKARIEYQQQLQNYKEMLLYVITMTPRIIWTRTNDEDMLPGEYFNPADHGPYQHYIYKAMPPMIRKQFLQILSKDTLLDCLKNNRLEEILVYLSLGLKDQNLTDGNDNNLLHFFLEHCSADEPSIFPFNNKILYKKVAQQLFTQYPSFWCKPNKCGITPFMLYKPNLDSNIAALTAHAMIAKQLIDKCNQHKENRAVIWQHERKMIESNIIKRFRLSAQGNNDTLNSDI